jgi:hypothetical protein
MDRDGRTPEVVSAIIEEAGLNDLRRHEGMSR